MSKCNWEKIDDFNDITEFNRFVQWIYGQIALNVAKEVAVEWAYAGATSLRERWFAHVESGDIWRLVWPDPPFTGIFEPVQGEAELR